MESLLGSPNDGKSNWVQLWPMVGLPVGLLKCRNYVQRRSESHCLAVRSVLVDAISPFCWIARILFAIKCWVGAIYLGTSRLLNVILH